MVAWSTKKPAFTLKASLISIGLRRVTSFCISGSTDFKTPASFESHNDTSHPLSPVSWRLSDTRGTPQDLAEEPKKFAGSLKRRLFFDPLSCSASDRTPTLTPMRQQDPPPSNQAGMQLLKGAAVVVH